MRIKCCEHCVPPDRHAGCHSVCEKYVEEKAKWDKQKEEIDKKRMSMFIPISFRKDGWTRGHKLYGRKNR